MDIGMSGFPKDDGSALSDIVQVKNPYFIADSPLLNQSINCRFFAQKSSSIPSNALLTDFQRVGKTSGLVWNASKVSPLYEFTEVIPLDLFVFIHAEQYYLDNKLFPIATSIDVTLSVLNSSTDVTSDVLCLTPNVSSFLLPPASF
jgi:hypothetical protein